MGTTRGFKSSCLAASLVATILAACAPAGSSPAASDAASEGADAASIEGTSWTLVEIEGTPIPEGAKPTLEIAEGGMVSGMAGCNQFTGGAEIGAGTIAFEPLASTRMACADAELTQLETEYLAALEATTSWRLEGETLVLGGDTELRFSPT